MGGKPRSVTNVEKLHCGVNHNRYKENPLEKEFALAWQRVNDCKGRTQPGLLDYLLDINNRGYPFIPTSNRDYQVAATVIQWLGTPVGQDWLKGVNSD